MNKRDKIFHPTDVIDLTRQSQREINITIPKFDDVEEVVEVYTGPSPDDIRQEISELREQWQRQKTEEQENLHSNLEMQRYNLNEELEELRKNTQDNAQQMLDNAEQEAQKIIARNNSKQKRC